MLSQPGQCCQPPFRIQCYCGPCACHPYRCCLGLVVPALTCLVLCPHCEAQRTLGRLQQQGAKCGLSSTKACGLCSSISAHMMAAIAQSILRTYEGVLQIFMRLATGSGIRQLTCHSLHVWEDRNWTAAIDLHKSSIPRANCRTAASLGRDLLDYVVEFRPASGVFWLEAPLCTSSWSLSRFSNMASVFEGAHACAFPQSDGIWLRLKS